MKKLISLVLLVLFLTCSFSVPALAANQKIVKGDVEITGNESYDAVTVINGKLTVKNGASLSTTMIKNCDTIIIEPGATVTVETKIDSDPGTNIEVGGKLQSGKYPNLISKCDINGNFTIKEGGTIDFLIEPGALSGITGKLKSYCFVINNNHLTASHSHNFDNGTCSVCSRYICEAKGIAHTFKNGKCTTCSYVCQNNFHNGVCPECGMNLRATIGSVFSEGSITIVVGIACAVVFGIAGFVIGGNRKKRSTENSASNEKEDE